MADRIRLSGITATGYHGVLEHERRNGQTFVADVVLHLDTRPAAAADRLGLTVDYGLLAQRVAAVLAGDPVDLLETLAERIAALVLAEGLVQAVDVVVHKPEAPVPVPVQVSVEIHRDRSEHGLAPGATAGPATATAPAPGQEPPTAAAHLAPATDRLDAVPAEPVDVVLALGSNVGHTRQTLRSAIEDLAGVPGLEITAVAPLARTAAVGGPEQPDYLNTVVLGRTTLSPRSLLHACQEVEARHGRVREEPSGPRTLDIDLVVHGGTVAVADDLELPHPRAHQRAFVLQPWAQVDPGAVLPGLGGGPVGVLAQTAPDGDGIRWMALDWWGNGE